MEYTTTKIDDVTEPPHGLTMIYNHCYWAVLDDCILKFGPSYQCNKDEKVMNHLFPSYPEGTKIIYIPHVYISTTMTDYI
jgi:hypothetical protein